jgi:hypothetical protein
MQRKYSYIIRTRKKELLSNDKKNIQPSQLDDDIFFDFDISDIDSIFTLKNEGPSKSINYSESTDSYEYNIICKCGKHFVEEDLRNVFLGVENLKLEEFNIKCPECNLLIDVSSSIKLFHSYSKYNIFKKRYHVFDSEERVKIVLFETKLQYNKKGKMFTQQSRKSISFNKINNRIFYSDSEKKSVTGVGSSNCYSVFSSFFENRLDTKIFCEAYSQNDIFIFRYINSDVLKPYELFFNIISKSINIKDKDRVFKELYCFEFDKKNTEHHNVDYSNLQNTIRKYIEDLSLVASIIQHSYNSNILFNKGRGFMLDMVKEGKLAPSYFLRKNKATSPQKILFYSYQKYYYSKLKFLKFTLKKMVKNNNIDLILNKKNINKFISLLELEKDSSFKREFFAFSETIKGLERQIKINETDVVFPKLVFNKLESYNTLCSLMSISKSITKDRFLYICNKYNLEDFIYCFHRVSKIYNFEEITKNSFLDYDNKIKKINFILKIAYKENVAVNDFPFYLIDDTIRFLKDINGNDYLSNRNDLLSCTTIEEIKNLHDNLYQKVLLKRNEDKDEMIRNFCKQYKAINNITIENINFKLIDNIVDLLHEGEQMKHCVGTYASGIASGKHLIFSVKDLKTEERATLELVKNNDLIGFFEENEEQEEVWHFSQLKAKHNKKSSEIIIKAFRGGFCEELKNKGLHLRVNEKVYDISLVNEQETFAKRQILFN